MINFKTLKLQQQWNTGKLHWMLSFIVLGLAAMMAMKYNVVMLITSIFRVGDSGVHGFWRGVDIRTSNLRSGEAQSLVDWVNARFIYDPERPELTVALFHNAGRGSHIHLQVHPNTCGSHLAL